MKKKPAQQLDVFETIVPVEDLLPGDKFRISFDSPNVYLVKEQFADKKPECKARFFDSTSIYFISHGRKVFKLCR
jgi:hypothetical protein